MKISQVKKLSPIDRLIYWITERESIRLKRMAPESPKPWTDDEILQSYRFCNVRRMDDKVSQWLLNGWYQPYLDHPNMLAAVALARFINKPWTLHQFAIGWVFGSVGQPVDWKMIKIRLRALKTPGQPIFNGAYMVRGNSTKSPDKVGTVVDEYVRPLVESSKEGRIIYPDSMERTWDCIRCFYGYGSFMAGQIVADLRWAVTGKWADRHTWAPVGPGSARGLGWTLYGDERETAAKEFVAHPERFTETLTQDLIPVLKKKLPGKLTDRLEAHDYQNCLCEFDKYNRTLFGYGRPKAKYPGK